MGVRHPTIKRYLDMLNQTFMVRVLPPLAANLKKRLVKTPKVYIRDSGLLHTLLEIENLESLFGHPNMGVSWEGWCIEQISSALPGWRASYYRTSSGEEIDLIMERGQKRLAFEFKASVAPKLSRGLQGSLAVLNPERSFVIAPVPEPYSLKSGTLITNIKDILRILEGVTTSRS
jgi:predicted AAA+ superfamily ATPase